MLRNYLIVAWRNLWRNRVYAFVSVSGLAVALVVVLITFLFVRAELTWDRFHVNAGRIYQAYTIRAETSLPGETDRYSEDIPIALGSELVAKVPGILRAVRATSSARWGAALLRRGDQVLEERGLYADPGFFGLFAFPLIQGDPVTALAVPGSMVITRRLATKLFGQADPLGQVLYLSHDRARADFTVTGVAVDPPYNTDLQFDWVVPFHHLLQGFRQPDPWVLSCATYLEIDGRAAARTAESWANSRLADQRLALIPLVEKHMHPRVGRFAVRPLVVLGALAMLVLLVACINLASLAAAMSLARAREIGVRKVIGAGRGQVAGQILVETLLLSYAAVILAVALTEQILPGLNRLLTFPGQFALRLDVDYTPGTVLAMLAIGTLAGLAAGAYPALFQSRLQPATILRQRLRLGPQGPGRRLVVIQFVVAVTFLTTALLVTRQQARWQQVDLGYDPGPILCLPLGSIANAMDEAGGARRFVERFRQAVQQHPGVLSLAGVTMLEGSTIRSGDRRIFTNAVLTDSDCLQTMGIRLLEGEDLPMNAQAGGGVALVSRQLARSLDGPALGAVLEIESIGPTPPSLRVVGVVEDFCISRVTEDPRPAVIAAVPGFHLSTLMVRLHPVDRQASVAVLRQAWNRLSPEVPFTSEFLQARLGRNLAEHTFYVPVLQWLAGFLMFISGLGIFGLASFAAARRTREVGVRKVFGAGTGRITWLLNAQFTRLILVALVFAWPLARILSEWVLRPFPGSRIGVDPLSYLAGAAIALLLTWLVSGYHTLRAALANPLECLRQE